MNSLLFLRASTQKINNLPSESSSKSSFEWSKYDGKKSNFDEENSKPEAAQMWRGAEKHFSFFFLFSRTRVFPSATYQSARGNTFCSETVQITAARTAMHVIMNGWRLFVSVPSAGNIGHFEFSIFNALVSPFGSPGCLPHRPPAPRLAPGLPVARAIHRRPTIRHPFDSLFLFFFLFFHRSTRHTLNYAYLAFKCYRIQGTEEITEDASDFRFRTPLFWVSEILGYIYIFFSTLLHILKIILEASINQLKLICIER